MNTMRKSKQPMRVQDIAALLVDGERIRELCPFCAGGSSREWSFAMERTGSRATYICYRASCGARGSVSYGGITPTKVNTKSTVAPNINRFLGDIHRIPVTYSQFFKNKFNIQPVLLKEFGVKTTDDGRVLFPIISPNGGTRGDNVRYYKELTPPKQNIYKAKATIYLPKDEIAMSWHRLGYMASSVGSTHKSELIIPDFFFGTLVVVEDQVSAIKASRMVDAVSLMGTDLNFKKIKEISDEVTKLALYEKVILLLDLDAYNKAIKLLIRTQALLPGITIRRLTRDVKDMTYTELHHLLTGVMKNEQQVG